MNYFKNKYIVLLLSTLAFTGCDFMNCDESSYYEKEDLLGSFSRTKQLVTNVYGYLPHDFCNLSGAMIDAATDDAIHVYEMSTIQRFVNGSWSANNTIDDVFAKYYEAIRAANFYMEETEGQTFEEWKFSDNYDRWMQDFANYKFEVRFLRAFYYFELAKRYQNVPLLTEVLTPEQANNVLPATCIQLMDFIVSECVAVAAELPVNYNGFADKETGRITKGMALALKSRATLYMASPLYSAHSTDKWKTAAKSAYELIGDVASLGYKLDKYATLFGANNNTSAEIIMARPTGENNSFESANFPMGVEGGRTSTCPTENLVSSYEMKSGEPFDWNDEEMRNNPYVNRDPRLAFTVAYNGMVWPKKAVEIWEGGVNGLPLSNATTTGYYLKKYVNKDITFEAGNTGVKKHHNWILFRYAEILLNYAEAMINAFDDPTYKDAEFPLSALDAVNQVRQRSDVKMPQLPSTLSADEFLKRLKNERRVEFAFEGQRFWDLRRWKELDQIADVYAVKIEQIDGAPVYTKELHSTRAISEKMNFYPISNKQLFCNTNLKQNSGW